MGVLRRWQQFGRRYLWPQLLLGVVAATCGVHQNLLTTVDAFAASNIPVSLTDHYSVNRSLWQVPHRFPTANVDHWRRHALRKVIRHLSFVLTPQIIYVPIAEATTDNVVSTRLHVAQLTLLSVLNSFLMDAPQPTASTKSVVSSVPFVITHQTARWLAKVHGIRAGPIFSVN